MLQYLVLIKHIKVLQTVVCLKTVVFLKYFKNTSLPNVALATFREEKKLQLVIIGKQ